MSYYSVFKVDEEGNLFQLLTLGQKFPVYLFVFFNEKQNYLSYSEVVQWLRD